MPTPASLGSGEDLSSRGGGLVNSSPADSLGGIVASSAEVCPGGMVAGSAAAFLSSSWLAQKDRSSLANSGCCSSNCAADYITKPYEVEQLRAIGCGTRLRLFQKCSDDSVEFRVVRVVHHHQVA